MTKAQCSTIFTSETVLPSALGVAKNLSIPSDKIYILPLPDGYVHVQEQEHKDIEKHKTIEGLILEGTRLEPLEELRWEKGQGKSQVAFLCSTSGTSGKQVCFL